MRHTKFALALLAAAALTACGGTGSEGGDQTHAIKFSQQVSFGDSLSDVGTYAVGAIAAAGGGKFTINGNNTAANAAYTGLNWTEVLAAELKLPAPCAAQTGLQGADNANPALDYNVPIVNYAGCFNYAQGGARVTNPVGAGYPVEMTVPVVTQIQSHLAKAGGKFSGTELVTVMAGGNDVLVQLGELSANATAAGTAAGQKAFPTLLIGGLAGTVAGGGGVGAQLAQLHQDVITACHDGDQFGTAELAAGLGQVVLDLGHDRHGHFDRVSGADRIGHAGTALRVVEATGVVDDRDVVVERRIGVVGTLQAGLGGAWRRQFQLGGQHFGPVQAGVGGIRRGIGAIDRELAATGCPDRADRIGADVREAVAEGHLLAELDGVGLVTTFATGAAAGGQRSRSQQRER